MLPGCPTLWIAVRLVVGIYTFRVILADRRLVQSRLCHTSCSPCIAI